MTLRRRYTKTRVVPSASTSEEARIVTLAPRPVPRNMSLRALHTHRVDVASCSRRIWFRQLRIPNVSATTSTTEQTEDIWRDVSWRPLWCYRVT